MSKADFASLNQRQEASGGKIFANPRNAAAGTMRTLDPALVSRRRLSAFVYHVVESRTADGATGFTSQSEVLEQLRQPPRDA